jgi:drug/metabolite transporter (DMT)-like permease
MIGLLMLALLALLFAESLPSLVDMLWGAAAGLSGLLGIVAFYRALAIGQMGIISPVTAVIGSTVPVAVGIVTQGFPTSLQAVGFVLGIAGVALVSGPRGNNDRPRGLGLALAAGVGFAGFFILISRVETNSTLWPLVIARIASIAAMLTTASVTRREWKPTGSYPLIALAGCADAGGNAFFLLAAQTGRLDVAVVLSSLYPAITTLLAGIILHEKLTPTQKLGVALALTAVPIIGTGG